MRVHQTEYTQQLLKKHGLDSDKTSTFEFISLAPPASDDCPPSKQQLKPLQALCGELNWLSVKTRPDIAYCCSVMASSITRFHKFAMDLGKKILRYLKRFPGEGLFFAFGTDLRKLKCAADAGYCGEFDLKSQTGFIIFWGGCVVLWRSAR